MNESRVAGQRGRTGESRKGLEDGENEYNGARTGVTNEDEAGSLATKTWDTGKDRILRSERIPDCEALEPELSGDM